MKRILFFILATLAFCCLLSMYVGAQCVTHTFENAVITTAPTCESDGVLTYTCSECGATETRVIPATHSYHSEVIKKASCTTQGEIKHTCILCGDTKTEKTDPVHAYHQTTVKAPTCEEAGIATNTCSLCGKVEENVTIPAAHTYTNLVELYAPSCFFEGLVQFDCSVCGKTGLTKSVAKTHENETTIIKEATCTTDGILRHTCLYCNTTHTDIITAKHTYDVLNGKPTSIVYTDYTSTGVKYYTCDNCDASEGIIANPIFIFLGYSATEYVEGSTVEISCGYTANVDALQEYQEVMGKDKLQFGVVGAVEAHLGKGVAPLVSETGEVVNVATDTKNFIVKKISFKDNNYSTLNGKLINIDYANHTTYFYLSLFIYDGEKTVYISDDSCRDVPLPISYAMLVDGDGGHDNVTTNKVQFGDITYSTIEGTVPSTERLDLIASSSASYKTEESSFSSARDENTIASIGSIGSWVGTVPNANALLNYYLELGGDATHYRDLDVASLVSKSTAAKSSWQTSINNILRAAELMAVAGETVNIDQTTETKVQLTSSNTLWSANRDWYLTFIDGFYYTDTDLNNLTVTEKNGVKTYTAEIVYTVIDYYSFYKYKDDTSTSSFLLWGPTKAELAQLHLDGNALDFLIESSITYSVTWTEGERVARDDMYRQYPGFEKETVDSSILKTVTK